MRIISGKARGTKLYSLEGSTTRPTLDRVKESLFNIIQNQVPECTFLDLFSGSGAIGLEAASRGANKTVLCEKNKAAISIIKKNIEKTHLEEKVELLNSDFVKAIKELKNKKIDIVYLDPPYKTDFIKIAIEELLKTENLTEDTLLIVETDEEERIINQMEKIKGIEIADKRKYGRAYILFLKKINGKEE